MHNPRHTIGIDLGGTNIQVGIVAPDGEVLARAKAKTQALEGQQAVLDRVASTARNAVERAELSIKDIDCCGMGVPGPLNPQTGVVFEAVNLRWENAPVAAEIRERLGVPVTLENDVNAAAWGEFNHGAGRGATNLVAAWLGTGVGGAFILNKAMFYGSNFTAGEIGHMLIDPYAAPGNRTLEHNCSRSAAADRLLRLVNANEHSVLSEFVGEKQLRSKNIAKAYHAEDPLTLEVIADLGQRLGLHLGSLVTALSLDRIVLGGGLTEAVGQPLVDIVRKAARKAAFPDVCKQVEVVASELEDDAGVIGAALLARAALQREAAPDTPA